MLLSIQEVTMAPSGGAREGAGRKPVEIHKPRKPTLSIMGTESELNRLRNKANNAGKSISRFVLESLNCLDSQNND